MDFDEKGETRVQMSVKREKDRETGQGGRDSCKVGIVEDVLWRSLFV